MKDIVFIVPCLYSYGGIARVTINVVNELIKTGKYKITLLSLSYPEDGKLYFEILPEVNVITLPIKNFNLRKDFIKVAQELKKLYSGSFEGTFVIDDAGYTIPGYLGLCQNKKARFICWTHTNFFHGKPYGFAGVGRRLAAKRFDKLITLTKEDQGYYFNRFGMNNRIVQIYNPKESKIIRKPYNVECKKIISCGRLDVIKGFDSLIRVAKIVFAQVEDWSWDIYGDGPDRERLQSMIKELKLEDRVHLMGYTDNILEIYGDYALDVFTSREEGCPMAMMEGLCAGLPMISFNFYCGPKDLISEGINGYIVENRDEEKLAERILEMIKDPHKRKAFSDNAECNLAELDLDYVVNRWIEIL